MQYSLTVIEQCLVKFIIRYLLKSHYGLPSLKKPLQVNPAMRALLTLAGHLVILKYVLSCTTFQIGYQFCQHKVFVETVQFLQQRIKIIFIKLCSNDNHAMKCIYNEVTKCYLRKPHCHLYLCIIVVWMIFFSTGTPSSYLTQNDGSCTRSLILLFFLDLGHFISINPICLTSSFDLSETKPSGLTVKQNNLGCNTSSVSRISSSYLDETS